MKCALTAEDSFRTTGAEIGYGVSKRKDAFPSPNVPARQLPIFAQQSNLQHAQRWFHGSVNEPTARDFVIFKATE